MKEAQKCFEKGRNWVQSDKEAEAGRSLSSRQEEQDEGASGQRPLQNRTVWRLSPGPNPR